MQSGLIDNNDVVNASGGAQRAYIERVRDVALRARILAISSRVDRNPATEFSPLWWIRLAAWQPLLFTPGSGFHYSNIGYDVLGLVAGRAGGKPLADLYRERIFEPLGLDATAYDPQGPIQGPHARGYGIEPDGTRFDASGWHAGVGAEGGIVSNAEETARFLVALMQGKLVDVRRVEAMKGDSLWFGGAATGCAGQAYGWSGGGSGYKTDVWVDGNGTRVAVLLAQRTTLGHGPARRRRGRPRRDGAAVLPRLRARSGQSARRTASCHSPPPTFDLCRAHPRVEPLTATDERRELLGAGPGADGQPGERRRADRGCVGVRRDLDRAPDQVGLDLHQETGWRSPRRRPAGRRRRAGARRARPRPGARSPPGRRARGARGSSRA